MNASGKKSFLLHHDSLGILDKLDDEQAGKLFRAIYSYATTRHIDCDPLTDILLHPFKMQLDRDIEKWEVKAAVNRENGAKGGRPPKLNQAEPRGLINNPPKPTGFINNPNNPPKPVSVNVSVSGSVSGSVNGSVNGNGSERITLVAQQAAQPIDEIFSYWTKTMNHNRAKLDDKRKKLIKAALRWGYSLDDLKLAIKGCSLTPHNIGQNDKFQRYDGLHIILRSADQIDRFIQNAKNPPTVLNKRQALEENNKRIGQEWVRKMQSRTIEAEAAK